MAMRVLLVVALVVAAQVDAEAGPGNEVEGQELELDEAYKAHVASLMSAISVSEGKSNVKYTDLRPQMVDVHTIAPRIPALKVGMNALGHKMFHVHSDEQEKWSAEIMSSGLSSGFTFTDRVKGLQKGDGKPGSQWSIYSASKAFRVKDEASGDLLSLQDGVMTLTGNKGANAQKPRLAIVGKADSVPRVTLISKQGESAKHISMYNRYGKFGIFSGITDNSIFELSADGSEMAIKTANVQPHITIQSTARAATSQEVILKGHDAGLKMYHKEKKLGFCNLSVDGKQCKSFLQASTDGAATDIISQTDSATLRISHKIRGKNSELHLVSQDKVGDLTSTEIYNREGTLGFRSKLKAAPRDLFTIKPTGEATMHGKLEVRDSARFKKGVSFDHNVNVQGVVTMQGKNVGSLFESVETTKRENMEMRKRLEEMEMDSKELRNRMVEMSNTNAMQAERIERLMSTMTLMQQTMTR